MTHRHLGMIQIFGSPKHTHLSRFQGAKHLSVCLASLMCTWKASLWFEYEVLWFEYEVLLDNKHCNLLVY